MLSSRIEVAEAELKKVQVEIAASRAAGRRHISPEILLLVKKGVLADTLATTSPVSVIEGIEQDACDFLSLEVVPPIKTVFTNPKLITKN